MWIENFMHKISLRINIGHGLVCFDFGLIKGINVAKKNSINLLRVLRHYFRNTPLFHKYEIKMSERQHGDLNKNLVI